jgi:hypothetical protein
MSDDASESKFLGDSGNNDPLGRMDRYRCRYRPAVESPNIVKIGFNESEALSNFTA